MALLIGLVVFLIGVRAHRAAMARPVRTRRPNHSPGWWVTSWNWVKSLVRRDPEPDRDPEPRGVETHGWGFVDYADAAIRIAVDRPVMASNVPLPKPTPKAKGPTQLDIWVTSSVDNGSRSVDIVREGQRRFGASESTIKRSIKKAKARR
jgi:hypothetical protein